MLLSPGHSPRRLSSPSPSPSPSISETPIHQTPGSTNSLTTTTPKNPRKRSSSTVLDEDTYVAAIEKIIERDFFPDLPKLRDRLDWLEASRTGDPMLMRDAQLKIMERRSGKTVTDTEGRVRTPGSTFFRNTTTPLDLDNTPGSTVNFAKEDLLNAAKEIVKDNGSVDADTLTLDEFFRKYTSEDNDSFNKLIEKVNRKKRERYEFLLEGENRGVGLIEDVKKDRITDGYGTSNQPLASLDGWKYTAKNLLMYHPADRGEVALTQEEMVNRLKGMTKEISKTNTRFHGKTIDLRPKEDDEISVLYNPVAGGTPIPWSISDRDDKMKKYDLEDMKKTPNPFYVESNKKSDNGYNFVKTPSPAPGVDESPFITWGEIEGTPLRLEPEDTPIDIGGSGNGPHFNIPNPPSRDLKAHSLSREASRKLRDRSRMFQKPPLPGGARGGSASPGARTLSPAAQKFVRNAIAKSSHSGTVDESLRASYRGSSPGSGSTPKLGRSSSRLGRDGSMSLRSPSVREGSNPPW